MKTALIQILFFLFPTLIYAQANSDFGKIKKEGIREVRMFRNKSDTFPEAVLQYDISGRLRKAINLYQCPVRDSLHIVMITEYDTLGRTVKLLQSNCYGRDPHNIKLVPSEDYSATSNFLGDSVIILNDSLWQANRLMEVNYIKASIRWQKTPPPFPRPILWQDSIESSFMQISKNYKFYYEGQSNSIPVKIDSTTSSSHSSYLIQCGKLTGTIIFENRKGDTVTTGETRRIYTLNKNQDTVQWFTNSQRNPPSKFDILYHFDNYHYSFFRVLETKRIGKWYFIKYSEKETSVKNKNGKLIVNKTRTKEPWNDFILTAYFTDDIFSKEDLSIQNAMSRFSCKYIKKIKY